MNFKAEIDIMPLAGLLDPQGKAVSQNMGNLDLSEITNVRIGKHITLKVDEACKKLLCNQIMESYTFDLMED